MPNLVIYMCVWQWKPGLSRLYMFGDNEGILFLLKY